MGLRARRGQERERELQPALARELAPEDPILVHLSYTRDGKTVYGNKPEEAVRDLMNLGADVVGANCSVGPQGLEEVVDRMLRVRLEALPLQMHQRVGRRERPGGTQFPF